MPRKKPQVPPFRAGAPCDEFDLRIMLLAESNPAATDISIAKELECDQETVGRRRRRPEYIALYRERNLPAIEIIRNARPLAAKFLVRELSDQQAKGKPADRINAAKAILGPGVLGPELPDGGSGGAGAILLPGDVAAGLLRYFASFGGGAVAEGRTRTA